MFVFAGLFLFGVLGYVAYSAWRMVAEDARAARDWRRRQRRMARSGADD